MTLEDDAELLNSAVADASQLALDWFRKRPKGREKTDGSGPVSDADLAIDAMLRERLTKARPDYGWLSEESPPSPDRLNKSRIWLVDPIDGTSMFLSGGNTFTVSAALVQDGSPVLAAMAAPALGELYCATRHGGATLNGVPVAAPSCRETLQDATLVGQPKVIAQLDGARTAPFSGSIVHRICTAALGRADGALSTSGLQEWDVCAAHLFAQELGLEVTDAHGKTLSYNRRDTHVDGIVAAPSPIASAILDQLSRLRRG